MILMDILDAIGRVIEEGKTVRYIPTGTTGEVEDMRIKDDKYWVKIANTNMWYVTSEVEVLSEDEIIDKKDYKLEDNTKFDEEKFKERQRQFADARIDDQVADGGG